MRKRLVTGMVLFAAFALPATASAEGITNKWPAKATLKYTERQDWHIVKPKTGGCSPVGSGHELLIAQTTPNQQVVLTEEKADSHAPLTAAMSPKVRWTDEVADDTTRTPSEIENGSCSEDPRDCGTYQLKRAPFSVVSRNDHTSLSDNTVYGPNLQNCFTIGWQQPWYAHKVTGTWKTKRWVAGHKGVHHVKITQSFRPETKRNTDYGDVQVTATVTFELTYRVSRG
jgi:hypothetical protein